MQGLSGQRAGGRGCGLSLLLLLLLASVTFLLRPSQAPTEKGAQQRERQHGVEASPAGQCQAANWCAQRDQLHLAGDVGKLTPCHML